MELVIQIQTLDEAVCVSFCANTPGKAINLSVILLAMSK